MEQQLNLMFFINRNDLKDLSKVTTLVREGWDIIHFDFSSEQEGKDTKVILIRKM